MNKMYNILLEDTGRTFNINMHTFDCFAVSKEEAVGKMYFERPEFRSRQINQITAEGETVYENPDFTHSINAATRHLKCKGIKNIQLRNAIERIEGWQADVESDGCKMQLGIDFIKGDELNQAEDTWYIDVADVAFSYETIEERDADYQVLVDYLNFKSTQEFKY